MSSKMKLALGMAFCALICVALYSWLAKSEDQKARSEIAAKYSSKSVQVYAAKKDIPRGARLDEALFEYVEWPTLFAPSEFVTRKEEFVGKSARVDIYKNEPLIGKRVGGLASFLNVPAGFTAVSIPCEDDFAVGGSILPGTLVNVYSVLDSKAELLAQDVLVLETSSQKQDSEEKESKSKVPLSWITVALKPELVEQVLSTARGGAISLTIPSVGDEQ